jgi:hypothetical protein
MRLQNTNDQTGLQPFFSADGTIATGGASQLLLPCAVSRSFLFIQNLSAGALYVEVGDARATATLTNGAVTSLTITNGGFGYTRPPKVWLYGGWNQNGSVQPCGQPGYPPPPNTASVRAVLTAGVVTSFLIDNPGSGYNIAPYVFLEGNMKDPFGVADPYFGSANSGFLIQPNGGNVEWNGTVCPTSAVSIWGATTGQTFTCRWMT